MSRRMIRIWTLRPPTTAESPRMSSTFAVLLPTTFPSATSVVSPSAALTDTASSGALVPNATTVSPTITGAMPKRVAVEAAPFTRRSAPHTSAASPAASAPKVQMVTGGPCQAAPGQVQLAAGRAEAGPGAGCSGLGLAQLAVAGRLGAVLGVGDLADRVVAQVVEGRSEVPERRDRHHRGEAVDPDVEHGSLARRVSLLHAEHELHLALAERAQALLEPTPVGDDLGSLLGGEAVAETQGALEGGGTLVGHRVLLDRDGPAGPAVWLPR